ncbi:hypothetical protein ACFX2V_05195 [Gilliamella apicola]|uniref:hypothetical protein n=1 Tax=Gilliamella apicola TaxID=1196095 RepID=UPI0039889C91
MGKKSIKVLRTNRILSTGVHIYPDRGEKFDSQLLNSYFDVFIITHLLRNKLFPYDVEVAEATFKTEFIKNLAIPINYTNFFLLMCIGTTYMTTT